MFASDLVSKARDHDSMREIIVAEIAVRILVKMQNNLQQYCATAVKLIRNFYVELRCS